MTQHLQPRLIQQLPGTCAPEALLQLLGILLDALRLNHSHAFIGCHGLRGSEAVVHQQATLSSTQLVRRGAAGM